MTTRTITECDRCRREVREGPSGVVAVAVGGEGRGIAVKKELCEGCRSKLDAFLGGRELDEPP